MAGLNLKRRTSFLVSAAFIASCGSTASWAQDAAAGASAANQGRTASTGQPVADDTTIIVTAQRRSQALIQVPQSVSVVGGETLERQQATSFQDYAQLIPGLNITQENPGESRVILRGINTGSVASTVSVYVDETPFGSSGSLSNGGVLAGDFDTFDVARIEVLRGPQGTLYGANALGGTLKFITALPDPHRFQLRGQAGVAFVEGGGTDYSGNGVVNVPLGDTLAFRASGFYRRNAGYVDTVGRTGSDVNRADSYGGRAQLLFEPTSNFSVRLMAIAQDIHANSPSTYAVDPVTLRPINPLKGSASADPLRFEKIPEMNDVNYRLYSGTVNWNFDVATLTSSTSYSTLNQNQLSDISNTGNRNTANALYAPAAPGTIGLAFENDIDQTKFTQEVRLASPDSSRFEWLLGAYYTKETALLFQRFLPFTLATQAFIPRTLTLGANTFPEFVVLTLNSNYEEIAGFASLTWHLTDHFDITAGGRYSHNSQRSTQVTAILAPPSTINGRSSESVFTWSIAPRLEITDHAALYARVAKGYRPGGPNAVPPNAPAGFPTSFVADTLVSYELGVRGETEDRMFGFDASVFHLDWNDILINTVFTDPATGTQFGANGNGRRARVTGAEGTFTLRPLRGLTGILNLAWTDAKLRDDTTPAPGILNLTGGLAGDLLPYTPRIQASLSTDYEWTLGNSARAYVGGNVRIVGDEPAAFNATYRATFKRRLTLDGYTTVDLRAGVDLGRVSISAFARNITNSHGLVNAGYPTTIPAVVGGNAVPFATASSIRPRTIGMTLGFSY
jgi:iron complex outermembrane receptor protein